MTCSYADVSYQKVLSCFETFSPLYNC